MPPAPRFILRAPEGNIKPIFSVRKKFSRGVNQFIRVYRYKMGVYAEVLIYDADKIDQLDSRALLEDNFHYVKEETLANKRYYVVFLTELVSLGGYREDSEDSPEIQQKWEEIEKCFVDIWQFKL